MNQSRPVREWLRADGLPALIAALACVAILSAGFAMAWPLSVDIGGTRDARFVLNFNEPERSQITSYRWTNGDSILALPRPPSNAPALLALRMQNIRPDGQPVPQVALNAEGRELASLTLPDHQSHIYYVLVPPTQRLDWAMRVRITSDNIFLAADPRPLGVVVDHAYLAPLGRLFLPNAWLVLWAAALGLFGYTLLRLAGIGTRIALAGSIIPAIPLAVLAVLYPPDVLPFVQRVPALIGIACLGLVIARWLAPPLDDPRRVLLRGEYLPIYMAIAWWMLPLFQFFMVWDAAPNVIPAPQTIWIGTGLLVALGGLAIWYALSGRHQIGHETHGPSWPEDVIFRPPALEKTGLQSQDHRGAEDRQAKAQTGPAEVPGRHQHARHPQPNQTDRNEKSRRPNQKNRVSRKNSPKRSNGIHHGVIGHALTGDAVVRRHIIRSVSVEGKEEQSSEGDQHQGADIGKRVAHQRKRFILAATWTAYGHIKGQ